MTKISNRNRVLEHRLTALEVNMKEVRDDIRGIKENHLEKIYTKLDEIEKQYYKRPGWAITGLCSLVVGLIIYIFSTFQ